MTGKWPAAVAVVTRLERQLHVILQEGNAEADMDMASSAPQPPPAASTPPAAPAAPAYRHPKVKAWESDRIKEEERMATNGRVLPGDVAAAPLPPPHSPPPKPPSSKPPPPPGAPPDAARKPPTISATVTYR
eukprot:3785228-Prymnesium_polylepis.1